MVSDSIFNFKMGWGELKTDLMSFWNQCFIGYTTGIPMGMLVCQVYIPTGCKREN